MHALTGLRFFLALYVVAFHFALPWSSPFLERLRQGGNLLVYGFFVLSGFVMAYVYLREGAPRVQARTYWLLRFGRIYPLYLLALLAFIPVAMHFRPEWSARRTTGFILNLLMLQDWSREYGLSWNYPGWSVSAEAFFYFVFPLLAILLVGRWSRARLLGGLAGILVLHGLFAVGGDAPDAIPFQISLMPLGQALFFVFGILLGKLFLLDAEAGRASLSLPIAGLGIAVITWAMYLFGPAPPPMLAVACRTLTMLGAGLLIYGLARGEAWSRPLLGNRALVFCGDASYAFYILQAPCAFLFGKLIAACGIVLVGDPPLLPPSLLVVFCGFVFIIASLAYLFIESPVRRLVRRRLLRKIPA